MKIICDDCTPLEQDVNRRDFFRLSGFGQKLFPIFHEEDVRKMGAEK
jgi:hypothetical protein